MSTIDTSKTATKRAPFRVADWLVDPATYRLHRGGDQVKIEPKVMDVLLYLADRAGEVVTREELEEAVCPGTVVGYDALTGTMRKLRKAFGDEPKHPQIIETVSKKGYRLIAPIQPTDKLFETVEVSGNRTATMTKIFWGTGLRWITAAVALLASAGVIYSLILWRGSDSFTGRGAETISIAVIPFDNLSDNREQQYFADGMTDDLITDLTRISSLFVISRDSTFAYKGALPDVRQIAHELNVHYILHGSVRRSGDQVRINAHLTDATTDKQLWAERFDGETKDLFRLQDDITDKIVTALALKLTTADRQYLARKDTDNLKAYENYLKGEQLFFRYAKTSNNEAREFFKKAIELDQKYARAYSMLAWTHTFDAMNAWTDSRKRSLATGERLANQALALEETLPLAYFIRGLVYRERGEYVKALVEAEKAVALDPNYANGHVLHATLLYYAGRPAEGLERMKVAIQLNPHYPYNYPFHLGQAYFILERYPEAIDAFKQGLETNPVSERLHVWLAAAYAQAGRVDDAKWEIEQVLTVNPEFSLGRIRQAFPFKDPADLERFLSSLRKAGLS